jgi:hypothetical protein
VLEELLGRIADIFPSPYLHIGMDEADIGGSKLSKAANLPRWQLFGEHLQRVHAMVGRLGRRTMIWGDHLLHSADLTAMVPREVIVCNWLYGSGHREDYAETTRYFLDAGFEVIGGPAGCWWGTLFLPHNDNLQNIVLFDRAARETQHPKMLGMSVTMWCSYRHLRSLSFPIMAYAGSVFSGKGQTFSDVMQRFTAERFGLTGRALDAVSVALDALHTRRARTLLEMTVMTGDSEQLAAMRAEVESLRLICSQVAALCRVVAEDVIAHQDEFEEWLQTARFLAAISEARLTELAGGTATDLSELYRQMQALCYRARVYNGMESEEPSIGQVPRFGPDDDNVAELMMKATGITYPI